MKIKFLLFTAIIMCITALASCNKSTPTSVTPDESTSDTTDDTTIHEHNFELYETIIQNDLFSAGLGKYKCVSCGETAEFEIPPATVEELGMPQLNLVGTLEGISKEDEVSVGFEYSNQGEEYSGYASLKYQGASSLAYPKKNFTIKLYKDDSLSEKHKIDFGFGKESKYCLKANYIDFTQSRNVVSAQIFADIVNTRKHIDENIKNAPNNGVINGYPIILSLNGEFYGIYTLNIPKDEWMMAMEDTDEKQAILMADAWSDSTYFRKSITNVIADGWEIEYCSTDDDTWVSESFNRVINSVMTKDGDSFRTEIEKYLDIEAAIDTMLFTYFIDGSDNRAKNMLYVTYDGEKWIPSMYDMDSVFGLHYYGELKEVGDTATLPTVDAEGNVSLKSKNLLHKKLFENYTAEVIARYFELRDTVMSDEYVINKFNEFTNKIPPAAYQSDYVKWPESPDAEKDNVKYLAEYLTVHASDLDSFFTTLETFTEINITD